MKIKKNRFQCQFKLFFFNAVKNILISQRFKNKTIPKTFEKKFDNITRLTDKVTYKFRTIYLKNYIKFKVLY